MFQKIFKKFSHFFLDNRHQNLGDERNQRRKPEIDPPYPIRVARGAFHLKLIMIMMINTWEARGALHLGLSIGDIDTDLGGFEEPFMIMMVKFTM